MKNSRIFIGLNALVLATAGAIAGSLSSSPTNACRFVTVGGQLQALPGGALAGCETIFTGNICRTSGGKTVYSIGGNICKTVKKPS